MKPESAGERLRRELAARGWAQKDLAEILGRPAQLVSEIIGGKKEITRETARQLDAALGLPAEFWLRLQDDYHLWVLAERDRYGLKLAEIRARARKAGGAGVR